MSKKQDQVSTDFDQDRADLYRDLVELGFSKEEANALVDKHTSRHITAVLFCVGLRTDWSFGVVDTVRNALRNHWNFAGVIDLEELTKEKVSTAARAAAVAAVDDRTES